jgi:hypothetical protein
MATPMPRRNVYLLGIIGLSFLASSSVLAEPISLRSEPSAPTRYLQVVQSSGKVFYTHEGQVARPVQIGDRLTQFRDQLQTQSESSAILNLDDGIGQVQVGPATILSVEKMQQLPDGSKVTRLRIASGQALFTLRKLRSAHSQFEVISPSGIAGVRGTILGISTSGKGVTTIATLRGKVIASAQGKQVALPAGLQSLIVPGKPPSAPVPLVETPHLYGAQLTLLETNQVRLTAQTEAGNLVKVDGTTVEPDLQGRFSFTELIREDRRVNVAITTPLGKEQIIPLTVLLSK